MSEILIVLAVIVLIIVVRSIRIIPQAHTAIVDFSEFADDPDFHFMPVFGDWETNTFYTNRDFMKKAQLFSSEESSILMNLSNDFPTATLIVVD